MQIGEFTAFNPIENYNNMLSQDGMELGKFGETPKLEGQVSIEVPKISDMKIDAETMKDLNALNVNPSSSVSKADTVDNFHKSLTHALKDGIVNVNNLQREAEDATECFASGGNIDVHSVMIASQKAQMGLEMAMQLRNKAISAYQTITKMAF